MMNKKIVISINTAWNIYNFRRGLIKTLTDQGYEVLALAPDDDYVSRVQKSVNRFITLPMENNRTRPLPDLLLFLRYIYLLHTEHPLVYLGYTVKPNVYGSLAAQLLGIPVINNIAGLGTQFIQESIITRIVKTLYKLALYRSYRVFFQNEDDRNLFISSGLVRADITARIPGSGINAGAYNPVAPPARENRPFRFLLVARMLRDKGICEFAEAANILRQQGKQLECQLLGAVDCANPNSVPLQQSMEWEQQGILRYLGKTDQVQTYLAEADCIVLPSYREGIPRTLLEAAAMERPIITSDTPGCRDVVEPGINGLLCQVKNAKDLAQKMVEMMEKTPEECRKMGIAGRIKIEKEFDEKQVIQAYLDTISAISNQKKI